VSSVLPITEIITIEDHKLYITFLQVAFGSQSLLEPTNDQSGDKRGVNGSQLKFLEGARPRLHTYRKAISPQNQVRQPEIIVEDDTQSNQIHVRHFGKQKLDKKISSSHQAFHQAPCGYVQETTT
jgi:hypothetical protein